MEKYLIAICLFLFIVWFSLESLININNQIRKDPFQQIRKDPFQQIRKDPFRISRWRTPIVDAHSGQSVQSNTIIMNGQPVVIESRQVADEGWDQTYNSGIGFHLTVPENQLYLT